MVPDSIQEEECFIGYCHRISLVKRVNTFYKLTLEILLPDESRTLKLLRSQSISSQDMSTKLILHVLYEIDI